MRLLLAAAAVSAAFLASPAGADAGIEYYRTCGGAVDYECNGTVCSLDCFPRQCLVWLDPLHSPQHAVCLSPVG